MCLYGEGTETWTCVGRETSWTSETKQVPEQQGLALTLGALKRPTQHHIESGFKQTSEYLDLRNFKELQRWFDKKINFTRGFLILKLVHPLTNFRAKSAK